MAERSKRIVLFDEETIKKINPETIKFFNKYKIDMTIRELSVKTIYGYETDLNQWFIYIYEHQGNQSVKDLDEDDLTEFFYYCKVEGNNTRRIKRRMSSISAFYKFLRKKRLVQENPLEMIDRPRKDVDVVIQTFLAQEQVDLMRQKLKESGDLQLETYVNLSLSTMARVNAISNIKWEQIDYEARMINNVVEKEGYVVDLYFNENVKNLLLSLFAERKENNIECPYVFISDYEGKLSNVSNVTMSNWAKKAGNMIGIATLHPHDFRHTSATLLKNSGMPLESVSKLLQHKSTDVTLKFYIKEDAKKIQAEKDKFDI